MQDLQVREATGVALIPSDFNRSGGIGRHNKCPAHHRPERCRPTRLHHHRHQSADGSSTNNIRHESQATPHRVPRGEGRSPCFAGIGAALGGGALEERLREWHSSATDESVTARIATGRRHRHANAHPTPVAFQSHTCGVCEPTGVGGVSRPLKARTGAVIPHRHDHQGSAHPPPPRCDRERR